MKQKTLTLLALTLCSYLPAGDYLGGITLPMEPQTEFEQLAVVMARYGNNVDGIQAINYAILQQNESAIDLLIKYGATVGHTSLECARKTGSFDLFVKIVRLGARLDYRQGGYLFADTIRLHQNDIGTFLIKHGPELGCDVLKKTNWGYLTLAERCGNVEIYNLLKSCGYVQTEREE